MDADQSKRLMDEAHDRVAEAEAKYIDTKLGDPDITFALAVFALSDAPTPRGAPDPYVTVLNVLAYQRSMNRDGVALFERMSKTALDLQARLPGYVVTDRGELLRREDAPADAAAYTFIATHCPRDTAEQKKAKAEALSDLLRVFRGQRTTTGEDAAADARRLLENTSYGRKVAIVTDVLHDLADAKKQAAHHKSLADRWAAFVADKVQPTLEDAVAHYLDADATVSTVVSFAETLQVEVEQALSKGPPLTATEQRGATEPAPGAPT